MAKRRSNLGGRLTGDPELLAAALVGYEQQRSEIVERIGEIQRQLGGRAPAATPNDAAPGRKRTMSPSARKRIAEAKRKRWAAFHKAQEPGAEKRTVAVQRTSKIGRAHV